MKPTIRNKVMGGFAGVLTLMAVLAVVSGYAVFSLRHSANQATRVGARLNSIAIEIQVHNLETQRRVKSYMALAPSSENQQKREMYLEEATFEIHEIQSPVEKARSPPLPRSALSSRELQALRPIIKGRSTMW
jgi:CHASE3 domain sensor protein